MVQGLLGEIWRELRGHTHTPLNMGTSSSGAWSQTAQVQVPALLPTGFVALDKCVAFACFLIYKMWGQKKKKPVGANHTGVMRIREKVFGDIYRVHPALGAALSKLQTRPHLILRTPL